MKSDTVTVAADGSSVVNVYYDRTTFTLTFRKNSRTVATITDKWGADIHDKFPIVATDGTVYKGQEWEVPNGCKTFTAGTNVLSIDTMPAENITFTANNQSAGATLYYYVEALEGQGTRTYNGVDYTLYKTVYLPNSGRLTESEEFHEIIGFRKGEYYPSTIFSYVSEEMYLYYLRNAYSIEYNNPKTLIKTDENVPYQKNLGTYYWEPTSDQAPEWYEPGSVLFEGWYLNPECSGDKFDFATHTMPSDATNTNGKVALSLYAKWVPVTHTVEFYLDKDALDTGTKLSTHPDIKVPHGSKVTEVPAQPENGLYTFVGWFYMENGVEKAFDFANMPINKDLKVYGKWNSTTPVDFTVYYKLLDANGNETDIQIAEPLVSKALDGTSITFEPKTGSDLYADYREGCFPVVQSHTMEIDIDGTNTYTFWYKQVEKIPYIVRYVLVGENGTQTLYDSVTNETSKAIVTENYRRIAGYMPDAYQKRLVVTAVGTDKDGDGVFDENVITFYYTIDTVNALYTVTHFTQPVSGSTNLDDYMQYGITSSFTGKIGEEQTAQTIQIQGFAFEKAVAVSYTVDEGGTTSSQTEITDADQIKAMLTSGGVDFKIYYKRLKYPYIVKYLDEDGKSLLPDGALYEPRDKQYYQDVVTETARLFFGYVLTSQSQQNLTIAIDEGEPPTKNVITFLYKKAEVQINYVAVGPDGTQITTDEQKRAIGYVNVEQEPGTNGVVTALDGPVSGSTAVVSSNAYRFVGWYKDAACTKLITDTNWVSGNAITPQKVDNDSDPNTPVVYTSATYYAKFEWNVSDLIIKKAGLKDGESAIVKVTGTVADGSLKTWTICLTGSNASARITGLKVDTEYTVTEDTNWTWSYSGGTVTKSYEKIQPPSDLETKTATATITNKKNEKWLYDESAKVNNKANGFSAVIGGNE